MNRYKGICDVKVLLILVILILGPASESQARYFTINDFHTDITIDTSGVVDVTETIRVTFERRRRGIFRDLPVTFINAVGEETRTPITVVGVTDEQGRTRAFDLIRTPDGLRLKVGQYDVWLGGEQVYVFQYRVENAIQFLDDYDELYWNVTGNDWQVAIESASARVKLAAVTSADSFSGDCYTGSYGSTDSHCDWEATENGAVFVVDRPLWGGQGLTLSLGWEKGVVRPPTSGQQFWWTVNLRENWVWCSPILAYLVMGTLWLIMGREPKVSPTAALMHGPPQHDGQPLSAGAVGTLVDGRLDYCDITGTVMGLGTKGYLRINEVGDNYGESGVRDHELTKLRDPDSRLTDFEKKIMITVFRFNRDVVKATDVAGGLRIHQKDLAETLYKQLVQAGYLISNPLRVRWMFALFGFAVAFVLFLVSNQSGYTGTGEGLVGAVVTGLVVGLFGRVTRTLTHKGAKARAAVLAFQGYMVRDRADLQGRPKDELFYDCMPFAVSLNVTEEWAQSFEGREVALPVWYAAAGSSLKYAPHVFARRVNQTMETFRPISGSGPRGSEHTSGSGITGTGFSGGGGLSGGGMSGGGAGGGGGGSW